MPPAATSACEYALPAVAPGRDADVEIVSPATITSVNCWLAVAAVLPLTCKVNGNVPAAAGVPVMVPAEPSASPAGSAPAVSVHVYGGVPPTAVSVCE